MKNKLYFSLSLLASVFGKSPMFHNIACTLVLGIVIFMSHSNALAGGLPESQYKVQAEFTLDGFYGQATLSPAANPSATVIPMAQFEDYTGFENAQMDAELSGDGGRLYVTITNVSLGELPANVNLGVITVIDGDDERVFIVRTDGGGTIVVEGEI